MDWTAITDSGTVKRQSGCSGLQNRYKKAVCMKQTLLFICCFIIASNIAETKKFFDPAIFQKCWRGVGEQPTFAEQICFWESFFLLQLHFLNLSNSQFYDLYETSCKIRTRQRGNCSTLAGKSRGGTPFCRTLKIVFPKSRIFCKVIFRCNCFHWNRCKFFVCGWWLETLLLGKSLKSGSARLGHIPSLPLESQLPLKPCA